MQDVWDNSASDDLFRAILSLDDLDEAKAFFRDLLTETELVEFSNRWKTARLLDANVPYSTIEEQTGMSSTTIARISKWLTAGMGGYRLALDKSTHHQKKPFGKG